MVIRTIITIVFIVVCVALSALVLMQEGKADGLGAISGSTSDTYWSKNKGRSMEGVLVKSTTILAIAFMIIAMLLNIPVLSG